VPVVLHDHGGWFFQGKEKLVEMEGEHVAVKQFRASAYGGRAYAEELAKRGYVVIPFGRSLQLQITHNSFHSLGIALRLAADRDPFWDNCKARANLFFMQVVIKVPLPWERDSGRG